MARVASVLGVSLDSLVADSAGWLLDVRQLNLVAQAESAEELRRLVSPEVFRLAVRLPARHQIITDEDARQLLAHAHKHARSCDPKLARVMTDLVSLVRTLKLE